MQRIGLFGGSFDPVHIGHLLVAQAASEELALSRLFFVVAAQSPFKPGTQPAPAEQRLRWLRMALAREPRYEIDLQEIERGGVSFTVHTVDDYLLRFPGAELFYLIGADHIPTLPKWRDAECLANKVTFVAIPRPGEDVSHPPVPFKIKSLPGFPLKISSSQLRSRIKSGLSIRNLVPAGVEQAILDSGNYR